jgi:hypothetical protein
MDMKSNVLTYIDWHKLNESSGSGKLIFSGGLDTRRGDKSISEQTQLVEDATDRKVEGFRYNKGDELLREISANPDSPVIMFSAGCRWADQVSKLVSNLNHVYIIEPYAVNSNGKTSLAVKAAVEAGVPPSNVMAGPSSSRGKGVVKEHQNTKKDTGHWGSLPYASELYISNIDKPESTPDIPNEADFCP